MIIQELEALENTIRSTQNFRNLLKVSLQQQPIQQSCICNKNNIQSTNCKSKVKKIRQNVIDIKFQLNQLKHSFPKNFQELVPLEYHKYLTCQIKKNMENQSQITKSTQILVNNKEQKLKDIAFNQDQQKNKQKTKSSNQNKIKKNNSLNLPLKNTKNSIKNKQNLVPGSGTLRVSTQNIIAISVNKLDLQTINVQSGKNPSNLQQRGKIQSNTQVKQNFEQKIQLSNINNVEIKKQDQKSEVNMIPVGISNDSLRNKIYRQLQELKGLQKRQNTFRMMNYSCSKNNQGSYTSRNTSSNSLYKRRSEQNSLLNNIPIIKTQSKNILLTQCQLSRTQNISKIGIQSLSSNQTKSIMGNSNVSSAISVAIPLISQIPPSNSLDTVGIKSLYCPNNHEYYSGRTSINNPDFPDGNGRLTVCCSLVPLNFAIPNIQFYNGGFQNGKFHGFGTMILKDGIKYVGAFKDGLRQGSGSLFYGEQGQGDKKMKRRVDVGRWKSDKFISNI